MKCCQRSPNIVVDKNPRTGNRVTIIVFSMTAQTNNIIKNLINSNLFPKIMLSHDIFVRPSAKPVSIMFVWMWLACLVRVNVVKRTGSYKPEVAE